MKISFFKNLDEYGVSSMMCATLKNNIIVYGGSNFKNICPPEGIRYTYNDIYLYDNEFNLINIKKGKIYPDRGITLKYKDYIYYISGANNTKIYRYYINNNEVIEEEFYDLGFEIIGGYGFIYNDKMYFGKEKIYELDINTLKLIEKSEFIALSREQSVYAFDGRYMYLLGGASNICHLDTYRYDVIYDKWEKLKDMGISLTGSAFCMLDDENLIITGGFNKEVYDEAVKKLSDIDYKREYFSREREKFKWNDKILIYSLKNQKFEIIGQDYNTSTCGSVLLNMGKYMYLVNGEIKPGIRTGNVYKMERN